MSRSKRSISRIAIWLALFLVYAVKAQALDHTQLAVIVNTADPLCVQIGAWESEGMVRRYAHLAPAQLAQHAEVISNLLGGTIAAQPQ